MDSKNTRSVHQRRAEKFAAGRGFTLERFLGFGNDGDVWETTRHSVVKIEQREDSFVRELNCYLRLADKRITEIRGFTVPQLLGYDSELLAIEMSFVFPLCILDFAKSYIDHPPDFTPEVLTELESTTQELFDDRWAIVRRLLASLRAHGIYYFDAKPSNTRFAE